MKKFIEKNYLYIVLFIFILAFFLRIYHLDFLSLWRDESFTANLTKLDLSQIFAITANDTQPPLHYVILKFWTLIFGFSEFSLRFVSVIFAMLTLFFVYKILNYLKVSKITTIFALALISVHPLMIYYSQEARAYALLSAFFAMTLYYFIKIWKEDYKFSNILFFILASLGGLYSHNIFVIPSFVFGLYLLVKIWRDQKYKVIKLISSTEFRKLFLSYIIILIAYLPWLISFVSQFSKISSEGFWLGFDSTKSFSDTFEGFFIGHTLDKSIEWVSFVSGIIFLLSIFYLILGIYKEIRDFDPEVKNRHSNKFYFHNILVVILLFIYLISFKTPFLYIRYVVFLAPLVYILIAKGFSFSYSIFKTPAIILGIAFVFMNFYLFIGHTSKIVTKADYRSALEKVNSSFDLGQDILISPNALAFHSTKYYSENPNYIYNPERDLAFFEGIAILKDEDFFDGDLSQFSKVYVVELWESNLTEYLTNLGFTETSDEWYSGISLRVFERGR